MKKYKVEITEILQRTIEIEANSEIEAETKVKQMYDEQEIILDYQDYIDVDFKCIK